MQNNAGGMVKWLAAVFLAALLAFPVIAATSKAKPEEVGLSSERLPRIHAAIQRRIDARDIRAP